MSTWQALLQHRLLQQLRRLDNNAACRGDSQTPHADPDNSPPRSRLFVTLPRETKPHEFEVWTSLLNKTA
jgi:hypothetical protein